MLSREHRRKYGWVKTWNIDKECYQIETEEFSTNGRFHIGERVLCYEPNLKKFGHGTYKPATIVYPPYNVLNSQFGDYHNLYDVKFDHKDEISHGHFETALVPILPLMLV
jgi:hypothetical protein